MAFRKQAIRTRQAHYQELEGRCLLAGDVAVVESTHLFIRGDGADNHFEIVADENRLVVNGLNGTTINGMSHYVIKNTTTGDSQITYEGGLRVHLGPGDDHLDLRDAQFEDASVVFGGLGHDEIAIERSTFGGRTTFQTFEGNDTISTDQSKFLDDFFAVTLDGQDSVTVTDTVFDNRSIVVTGNQADVIHSLRSHYRGDLNLILPFDGDDTVRLDEPVVGQDPLSVYLGDGDDFVGGSLDTAVIDSSITIAGQAGSDERLPMSMSEEVGDRVAIWGIEKGELVFESALGGFENVSESASSYTTTWEPGGENESTYIEQYATPVLLGTTANINQIEWTGQYVRDYLHPGLPDLGDHFFIEIFEDDGEGTPDVSSVVRFDIGDANRVVVGEVELEYYGIAPLYGYHAEIDYTMEAGKTYWISIFTKLDSEEYVNQNHWEWALGIVPEGESTVFNQGYDEYQNQWRWHDQPYTIHGLEMDLRLRIE